MISLLKTFSACGSSGRCFLWALLWHILLHGLQNGYDEDWCYQPREGCFRGLSTLIHQCRVQYHSFSVRRRRGGVAPVPPHSMRARSPPAQPRQHAQPQAHPILQERVASPISRSRPMNSSIRRTLPRVRRPMWSLSRWRQAWTAFTVRPTTIPWCASMRNRFIARGQGLRESSVPLPLNVSTGPDVPLVEHHAPRQGGHVHPQVVGKRFGMAQREHHVQVVRIQTFRQVRQEAGAVGVKVIDGLEPFPQLVLLLERRCLRLQFVPRVPVHRNGC